MNGKYVSLTSFRRDGTGVATPVWFVEDNGRLFVRTGGNSFKVKRIARDPSVTIAECTASGRVRGEPKPARAEILPASDTRRSAELDELLARKYRVDRVLTLPIYRAVQWLRRRPSEGESVYLAITPTDLRQ